MGLIGVLLIMGLYHLGLYSQRREDKGSLWFGLLCLDVAFRQITIGRLAQVVTEAASADHVRLLRHYWQLPMYHLDFKEAAVPLETLQADREAQLWAEAGYGPEYG